MISNKKQWIKLQNFRKPIGPANNETKSRPHKITNTKRKPNISTFLHHTLQSTIII